MARTDTQTVVRLLREYAQRTSLRGGHCHTTASDGTRDAGRHGRGNARARLRIFWHSRSAHYAGGLSLDEINRQHRKADRLNKRYGKSFRILKGIEADILGDGSLDYPDRVLSSFDFIVASIHSRFKMTKIEQTNRILKAIENRYTTVIGHMTGRQLASGPGYDIDIDKVLKACAEYGVAVEINAHPWRLDLDWRWHEKALDYGCIFGINPDAHSIKESRPYALGG
jgi:DNA polymerase (family 10)